MSLGFFADTKQRDWLDRIAHLEFAPMDVYGTGELPSAGQGFFLADAEWKIHKAS